MDRKRSPLREAIAKAEEELDHVTVHDVQIKTAYTWAGRAIVAARRGMHDDAHEYAHEAIEHAALTGDDRVLQEIRVAFRVNGVEA